MFQALIEHYRLGNFQAVIDLYEREPQGLPTDSETGSLVVAQSYYKQKQADRAAPLFLQAALAGKPPKKQLLELAFALSTDTVAKLKASEHLLAADPQHFLATQFRRHYLPYYLMFDELDASNRETLAALRANDAFAISCELPWDSVCWCPDEKINAAIFNTAVKAFTEESRAQRRRLEPPEGKVRIGYLSNDFSTRHATMVLFRRVLECHDRDKFDIRLFCYTPGLVSIDEGFRVTQNNIIEIGHLDDAAAAELVRSHQLDLLVDLKGHTFESRGNLVNLGLAPVQAAFLGFPGSGTGIDCDYVIGDRIVTPDSSRPFYHEKLCRLPESYQPNDNVHRPLPPPTRRSDLDLPAERIVFASFNATRKISPQAFDAWMRILKQVPDSVLWMMCKDPTAQTNLLAYAGKAGIEAERIVFASSTGQEAHISRLQAASIGLDTFPCNGHTTTSDKLWAGLPVVSVRGGNFASRVSESLLNAVDLPELVAGTVDDYVALAVKLAREPQTLAEIRRKLSERRFSAPLFDTERYTRHLEAAFEAMAMRCRNGQLPDHLDIAALPEREAPFRG
jgi:predicted O-linked N-acetylglucosamine transferase (SPINDLY family)